LQSEMRFAYFNTRTENMLFLFLGLCRALSEKDYQLVGRVRFGGVDQTEVQKVPLLIGPKDLHIIHQKVMG